VIRPITLRLPESVYERIRQMAAQRGISFNALVEESLVARIEAEEQVRLFEAFTEVDFALVAQRETTASPDV
jgi:predicted DNA-binding ribbon-helix-helix protein